MNECIFSSKESFCTLSCHSRENSMDHVCSYLNHYLKKCNIMVDQHLFHDCLFPLNPFDDAV